MVVMNKYKYFIECFFENLIDSFSFLFEAAILGAFSLFCINVVDMLVNIYGNWCVLLHFITLALLWSYCFTRFELGIGKQKDNQKR